MDYVYTALGLLFLPAWATVVLINALKRKWGFFALALILSPWSVIGVFRLARPDTWWFNRRYSPAKRIAAAARYPEGRYHYQRSMQAMAKPERF